MGLVASHGALWSSTKHILCVLSLQPLFTFISVQLVICLSNLHSSSGVFGKAPTLAKIALVPPQAPLVEQFSLASNNFYRRTFGKTYKISIIFFHFSFYFFIIFSFNNLSLFLEILFFSHLSSSSPFPISLTHLHLPRLRLIRHRPCLLHVLSHYCLSTSLL